MIAVVREQSNKNTLSVRQNNIIILEQQLLPYRETCEMKRSQCTFLNGYNIVLCKFIVIIIILFTIVNEKDCESGAWRQFFDKSRSNVY